MQRVVDHVVPGRWDDARRPNDGEIKGTTILALPLDEASAKIRSGPPTDDDADLELRGLGRGDPARQSSPPSRLRTRGSTARRPPTQPNTSA